MLQLCALLEVCIVSVTCCEESLTTQQHCCGGSEQALLKQIH